MSKRFLLLLLAVILALAGLAGAAGWVLTDLPAPEIMPQRLNTPSARVTDRSGRLLYEVLPEGGGRNIPVELEQIPLALRQATIATEDAHFYTHPGVDLDGVARALWLNLREGATVSGGSTITQQVARNLLLSEEELSERSLRRKLREMALALQLTRRYSKDEILAFYLNQMNYGGMAYGVEAAAQTYFGKPVNQLDLAECALLAGIPQTPALYNPFTQPEAARARQRVVLGRMQAEGYIDAGQREQAEREPLALVSAPYPLEAPHFVMMALSQADELLGPGWRSAGGGLEIRTTLDLDWQHAAEQAVRQQLTRLREHPSDPMGHNVNNAALVAIQPENGEILALVGSPDYGDEEHAGALNMALAPRQPGSALKPLIYAAAFDPSRPQPWTAATMLLDVSTRFNTHEGNSYVPVNYDGLEHGPVLAREALASSLNIPAVITLDHVGLQDLFSFASRLGITTLGDPLHSDLSIALGGGEVRLLDLTAAYGAFANGGYRVEPQVILDIVDPSGQVVYTAPRLEKKRVVDERVAWLISDILSDDAARSLGFGQNSALRLDRPAAVKTGTTTNFHDNWTVGYTPDLVVGVWVGNSSHEAMRAVTGLSGAAPIWHQFMRTALGNSPASSFTRPGGLVRVEVCALSGLLPGDVCPFHKQEWFIEGTEPTQLDPFYQAVILDTATGLLADTQTPEERRMVDLALDVPPAAERWARANGLRVVSDLLRESGRAADERGNRSLWMVSPLPNATYILNAGAPAEGQRIKLEAAGQDAAGGITVWVDGAPVGAKAQPPFEFWWQLTPGRHQVWAEASDPTGAPVKSETVWFEVK